MERAGGIIRTKYNSEYYYLLVQGRDTGKWSFPKGHIDTDESYLDCATREILEETGIDLQGVKHNGIVKLRYTYFLFNLPNKFLTRINELTRINDVEEIATIKWFSITGMEKIEGNIDVRTFVKQQQLLQSSHEIKFCVYKENCKNVFCRFWHPEETTEKHFQRCYCNDIIYIDQKLKPIKKPRNSYHFFVMKNRENIKQDFPNLSGKSLVKKISHIWKQLSEDIRERYNEMALEDKNRYQEELLKK